MLRRFLTTSVLAGLTSAVLGNEYRLACEAVAVVMSNASDVYYPGRCE